MTISRLASKNPVQGRGVLLLNPGGPGRERTRSALVSCCAGNSEVTSARATRTFDTGLRAASSPKRPSGTATTRRTISSSAFDIHACCTFS
jgi:hypothetical protein